MDGNGSGVQREIDMEVALDLLERGESVASVARELSVSDGRLRRQVRRLQEKQGILLQYRSIQALQLTELQAQVLNAITPDKIHDASLKDLVSAYKILKDRELVIEGKPSEIKGLMAHLIYLEKQEQGLVPPAETLEAEYRCLDEDEGDGEPKVSLADLDTDEF